MLARGVGRLPTDRVVVGAAKTAEGRTEGNRIAFAIVRVVRLKVAVHPVAVRSGRAWTAGVARKVPVRALVDVRPGRIGERRRCSSGGCARGCRRVVRDEVERDLELGREVPGSVRAQVSRVGPGMVGGVVNEHVDGFIGRPTRAGERDGRTGLIVGLVRPDRRRRAARIENLRCRSTRKSKSDGRGRRQERDRYERTVRSTCVARTSGHARFPPLLTGGRGCSPEPNQMCPGACTQEALRSRTVSPSRIKRQDSCPCRSREERQDEPLGGSRDQRV